jgi:hypothetical protein
MHLAEVAPEGSVPQINARLHPSGQVLPATDETEIGRYCFSGGILSAASQSSGQLMRLLPAEESQDVQLIPFISGDGILVVTDRRLLGQMNGESPLSDRIDDGGDGHLYFSMGYEDVDSISISQETTKVGALEERRVNVHGLQILGALGVEVTAAVTLSRRRRHRRPRSRPGARSSIRSSGPRRRTEWTSSRPSPTAISSSGSSTAPTRSRTTSWSPPSSSIGSSSKRPPRSRLHCARAPRWFLCICIKRAQIHRTIKPDAQPLNFGAILTIVRSHDSPPTLEEAHIMLTTWDPFRDVERLFEVDPRSRSIPAPFDAVRSSRRGGAHLRPARLSGPTTSTSPSRTTCSR